MTNGLGDCRIGRMRSIGIACTFLLLAAAACVAATMSSVFAAPPGPGCSEIALPEASELVHRIVERGRKLLHPSASQNYTYDKRSLEENLDDDGRVAESMVKWYRVRVVEGKPISKLIRIEGRDLTQKELDEEDRRENGFRQQLENSGSKKRDDKGESTFFSESELERRFEFRVIRREIVEGRPSLVMTFRPKGVPNAGRDLKEKILGQISGTLWIDEQDAEIAKLQVSLGESVSFGWFGIAGSLHRFQLGFERIKTPDGIWITLKNAFSLRSRILFKTLDLRRTEHSSGFSRE